MIFDGIPISALIALIISGTCMMFFIVYIVSTIVWKRSEKKKMKVNWKRNDYRL